MELESHKIPVLHFEESCTYAGNEGFYAVDEIEKPCRG